ncbi:hypothetical protein WA1_24550 [Scytonema hofmannii PCC 7110]|uniref:Uncharacterized protein n=1 Tax=Scytonema hofmannii PCC 7110 TaxID=128403 RepID=A0A139X7X7_9CYAN|nr:hypothetical protein [Scytonema hofmannii]KYC40798.1 hypothetical protein WA1_24550 [Scytonema hofmannii PCC 7110]
MNNPVELPSGKILNIVRFVALIPTNTNNQGYDLILEGYSSPIYLEPSDASALKQILQLDIDRKITDTYSSWDKDEQLRKNQKAIALLAKRIERHQNMSEEESKEREELFEEFKQRIDALRLPGQKLYSQS